LGIAKQANDFKDLLWVLNKKNIDKLNLQSKFYKDKYFNKVRSHLNLDPEQSTLEEIIERLIIENQFI
jgi:hypothetical protein